MKKSNSGQSTLTPFFQCGFALMLAATSASASAASFDCKKAKTQVEKAICEDPRLSKLDEELAVTYRDAMSKAERTEKIKLRKGQTDWLKARNACKDKLCIEVMYRTRNAMLAMATSAQEAASADLPSASPYGKFWLTYGEGVKVCEAYLDRLNHSSYEYHPRCDRPEEAGGSGFQALNRVKLGAEEIQPFWASVRSFIMNGDPDLWKRADASDRKLGRKPAYGDRENQLRVVREEMSQLSVFRFEPPIDIDNDGLADPIIIWRSGSCRRFGPVDEMHYWESIAIVLNSAGNGPDVERTRQLFGHPSGAYKIAGHPRDEFRPIGKRLGIFNVEGTYYMDTFFDDWGDFHDGRRNAPELSHSNPARHSDDPEIANRLGVFLRRNAETSQMCEYWFEEYSDSVRWPPSR